MIDAELLTQLRDLVVKLQAETSHYSNSPEDQQSWYNRGYANGMILAMEQLGHQSDLQGVVEQDQVSAGERAMLWGKAYVHGEETGYREVYEIVERTS